MVDLLISRQKRVNRFLNFAWMPRHQPFSSFFLIRNCFESVIFEHLLYKLSFTIDHLVVTDRSLLLLLELMLGGCWERAKHYEPVWDPLPVPSQCLWLSRNFSSDLRERCKLSCFRYRCFRHPLKELGGSFGEHSPFVSQPWTTRYRA